MQRQLFFFFCMCEHYFSESKENFMVLRCASIGERVRYSWQKWSVSWPLTVEIELVPSPHTIKFSSTLVATLAATLMLLAVQFLAR